MTAAELRKLPENLAAIQQQMEGYARQYGLDCFPILYELVDPDQLHAIAACGGFPTRYPHWRWGMEYERLAKGYSYGLQKIYELVINNDPCYAYLLSSNALTDHKLVMAHVCGHCDFFKNNAWFSQTNRHMIDEMANHGNRIRRYMDRFGIGVVEDFIDACLSIEDLIDIHSPFIKRRDEPARYEFRDVVDDEPVETPSRPRFKAKSYMDEYINPRATGSAAAPPELQRVFPERPMRDVMLFVLENAPLGAWQRDVLSIVRDEAYYFAPQGQTKIMNEGWATYWHSTIMTRHGMEPGDLICYADHCSGTLAGSATRLNPYKLGVELFRDIEDRWNRGCHGEEFERCDDWETRRRWNTRAGEGRDKIFEVRRIHNDLTFIDEFLTLEFCQQHKLFQFGYNRDFDYYEIESRKFEQVKQQLLFNLTNMGRPLIDVIDGNYRNRGELYLQHHFNGVELKRDYAEDTLKALHRLWQRPVHIETSFADEAVVLSYNGRRLRMDKLSGASAAEIAED
ncbi:MAG: SpoVR family protein [Planctomycetales bacterium]|nr:SpoVR family protein [Planctomycetales bacterium]